MSKLPLTVWEGKEPPPEVRRLLEDSTLCRKIASVMPDLRNILTAMTVATPEITKGDITGAGHQTIAIARVLALFKVFTAQAELQEEKLKAKTPNTL